MKEHKRRKKAKDHKEELTKDIPHEEHIIDLPEEEKNCPKCGTKLVLIGKKFVNSKFKYIQAQVKIIDICQNVYKCVKCEQNGDSTIVKAKVPQPVILHFLASSSVLTHIIEQKFVYAVPYESHHESHPNNPETLDKYMPWSENIQTNCR